MVLNFLSKRKWIWNGAIEKRFNHICLKMKERITITLDKELVEWLDKKIEEKIFANRSHGLEFLIMEMSKKEAFFEHTRKSPMK